MSVIDMKTDDIQVGFICFICSQGKSCIYFVFIQGETNLQGFFHFWQHKFIQVNGQ